MSASVPFWAGDTPGVWRGFAGSLVSHVTYYLFAPQGSGEAESLTPLKWWTTPHLKLS